MRKFFLFISYIFIAGLTSQAQTNDKLNSINNIHKFDINDFHKGDTVMLGYRSSYQYGYNHYKYIKQFKYRKLNHRVNKKLVSKSFVIKRTGTEKRFLHNKNNNKQDIFIRFGKKGLLSRKDYIANLTGAIKSGEIITRLIEEYSEAVFPDTTGALTFFYYIKSNNHSPSYYASEYHYYFMKGIHKLSNWRSRPQYEKSLELAVKIINETLAQLDYNNTYSFITVYNIGDYNCKKKGYYIESKDSVFGPFGGYHDAPATKIVFTNIKDFIFLPVDKNFTHPFVSKKDPKRYYFRKRVYARVYFKFLNMPDKKISGHCRSVYAEIERIEFYNDIDDISYWIGTIKK